MLIAWKSVAGAYVSTTELNADPIFIVSFSVCKQLQRDLSPPHQYLSLPLEAIPEDQAIEAQYQALPGELLDYPANEDPDTEEEAESVVQLLHDIDADWRPDAQTQKDVKIAHDNAGHPMNRDFARLRKRGNAKPAIVRWVKPLFQRDQ